MTTTTTAAATRQLGAAATKLNAELAGLEEQLAGRRTGLPVAEVRELRAAVRRTRAAHKRFLRALVAAVTLEPEIEPVPEPEPEHRSAPSGFLIDLPPRCPQCGSWWDHIFIGWAVEQDGPIGALECAEGHVIYP